ncbi:hypothetical protein ABQE62_29975 [Mycolicibacterium fortuitum]
MVNKVRPDAVQVGDRIATKSGTWFTVGEIKTTLMPKPGWPEDQTISPSHATVYTFVDRANGVVPYSYTDEELIEHEPGK